MEGRAGASGDQEAQGLTGAGATRLPSFGRELPEFDEARFGFVKRQAERGSVA